MHLFHIHHIEQIVLSFLCMNKTGGMFARMQSVWHYIWLVHIVGKCGSILFCWILWLEM